MDDALRNDGRYAGPSGDGPSGFSIALGTFAMREIVATRNGRPPSFAMRVMRAVMREYKAGKLHSGGDGKVVKNPKQAVAIAMSEAGIKQKAK